MTAFSTILRGGRRAEILLDLLRELEAVVATGHPVDHALSRFLRDHPEFGARDRRFYSESVFAYFRWRGWSGTLADRGAAALVRARLLDTGPPLPPPLAALAADAGLDPARWPLPPPAGLASKARALAAFDGGDAPPPVERLVPDWTPAALGPDAGGVPLCETIAAFQSRPPLWLRASGVDGAELARRLRGRDIAAATHPNLPCAVRVEGHPHLPTLEQAIGPCFDVQDLASQAVGAVCAPHRGERWLDACAGGGGKTLHLMDLMERDGRVLASDVRARALVELDRRTQRLGLAGISTSVHDAASTPFPVGPLFDGVLVDAPCSGLGTWPRNPDARWRTTPGDVAEKAALQALILDHAAAVVRPGGRLVYSVCTLTRAETVDIVAAFDRAHPELAPDPGPHPLCHGPEAPIHWIHPARGPSGGMFIARWRRQEI